MQEWQCLQSDPAAEQVQPDAGVGTDKPTAVSLLRHLAVPVEHAPVERLFAVAHPHRGNDMFDDILVAFLDAVDDKARRGAHAVGAAITDAAGILDHIFGKGTGAVPDSCQIARFEQVGGIEGRIGLGVGYMFDVHLGIFWFEVDDDGEFTNAGSSLRFQSNRKY